MRLGPKTFHFHALVRAVGLQIRAADELFYKQGFEHTSFADVAEAVGISRGNFY